jgi:uncharacterized protein (UPF0335 family)
MARTHTGTAGDFVGVINGEALERFVLRIEALDEERAEHNATRREVYDQAKEAGLVPAILRQIVKERKLDAEIRNFQYALLDAYRRKLGLLADLPLGEAAMKREEAKVAEIRKPRPFAEQTVHDPARPRGHPRKTPEQAFTDAQAHLGIASQ